MLYLYPIPESKVKAALEELGRNKSPGADGIPIELFQATESGSVKILTRICQETWKTKQWPTDWKHSIQVPIFQKGDAMSAVTIRPLLLSHTSKLMLKVMQRRLLLYMMQEIPDVQAGFRKEVFEI